MGLSSHVLLVGEVIVDFTLPSIEGGAKLRLGGIVHAARGMWAANLDYSVAAICPSYLVSQADNYLAAHGCSNFTWLGEVVGAPNIVVIGDTTEVSDQGYEDILREEKETRMFDVVEELQPFTDILIFPGNFNLSELRQAFSKEARFSFDIAYDIRNLSELDEYKGSMDAVAISTSSELFMEKGAENVDDLLSEIKKLSCEILLLKENRGGSRLYQFPIDTMEEIPASLGQTVNSVGVGDVYTSTMVGFKNIGWVSAAWRGSRAATCYSQTTFPDDFKRDVQRELKLEVATLRSLSGTFLPWHDREGYPVYLAAPEFSHIHKPEINKAVESLSYHNFRLRRPIIENGQVDLGSNYSVLREIYASDIKMLEECSVVFAIPIERDPGTLFEIGMAVEKGLPVITYDPRRENNNTMIVAGSRVYSQSLDRCVNGLFDCLSNVRKGAE